MDDHNSKQPLLEEEEEEEDQVPDLISTARYSFQKLSNLSFFSSFVADDEDIAPIDSFSGFLSAFKDESSKLWYLAGPAIFTSLCQYSLGAFTQTFAGHVGTLELAAFSIENSVIAGLSLGVMLGMGSAVETLCGQAFGAGQHDMLGVYLQRSWIILLVTGVLLMFLYIFSLPFLLLIGQTESISRVAGKLALWMIPQLFAYALNFPTAKFLQAQSKIMAMAWISAAALALHVVFSWLLMLKLGWGMAGGAAVLDVSWWFIVILQLMYVFSGTCGKAWPGFTLKACSNLWGFVKLSLASAVMMCTNILGWTNTISFGFNAAISVRVSNELGASRPRTAKFSVVVMVISSFLVGLLVSILLLVFQNQYPSLFSDSDVVKEVVYDLTPLLAFCIVVNSIQPGLSGVAIGAGWQGLIAYVNIVCYYVFGVPLGLILGYQLNMGVKGIWYGMVAGTVVQTLILLWIVYKTDWNKEASIAAKRIKYWRRESHAAKAKDVEKVINQAE
ncbi:protein transparent testa 12 [Phtheirospermum japonicum]|uniref:Protein DETOXIFICATION n=1 Tax=Phtheirospermum japonicum TaxID=374723 RepID=A0A830BKP0_9LAMI|nr:protein transparent testa 12 [Phtheirospermum japonicum]